MIAVRVLGPVEVTFGGAVADVGGPRQRCVLARLIAAHGQVVSADRLIEDLYSDEGPPRALAAVQSYVSHLRRALEPGRQAWGAASVLVTSPPGYAIRLDRAAVDAWQFEDEVHRVAGLDDPGATHDRLSTALTWWRGTAFQEFGGLPWADLEASRLDELRLLATERLAECSLRLGRTAQAVVDLDRLTADHPLREEAWRLLALALYQSGRQGDALAALRRARARLAEELGIDPGPLLRQLEENILAQDPRLAPPLQSAGSLRTLPRSSATATPAAMADGVPPVDAAHFVGRVAELEDVMRAAKRAAAGRSTITLVTGEPGAGKTALAEQISERLADEGWTVTAGRCPEHEGAPAAWPWAEALRRLAAAVPPDEPEALAALLTDSTSQDGDVAAARFRLHRAVAAYLDAVSRSAPLLVILDDLHRADGESLTILADTTAGLAASRILVLATYRSGEVSEQLSAYLASLAAREPVRMVLRGLDASATAELVRATCTRPVDEPTVQAIAARTGGNPFFIKETARLLDSEGAAVASTAVPTGVREVLGRRIARLPGTAQTILRQASVLGTEADVGVLGDLADVDDNTLLNAVEAGLLTGLVTEPTTGRIRFTHALVRDTFYQSLSRLRRSRLHTRAAEAIERQRPDDVAALAHHYAEGGTDPVKAAKYCALAAEQAEQRFAYQEAARLWEQAVACIEQAGCASAREKLDLILSLVRALAHAGQLARARAWRRDAVRAALPLDDPDLIARVITAFDEPRLWYSHAYAGTDHELVATVEETLASLPGGDHQLRCRLLTTLAFELESDWSERGYQASAQAVEMGRRLRDPGALTIAIIGRYFQSFRHDEPHERRKLAVELLALPGIPITAEAIAHVLLTAAASSAADFTMADLHAAEATRIADRYDLPTTAALIGLYHAMRCALNGDLTGAALRYQRTGDQMNRFGPGRQGTAMSTIGRFTLLVMQDRTAEMASEFNIRPAPFPELYTLALAASGRDADARQAAARLESVRPDRFWLFLTSVRGLLAIAIDDRERAQSSYNALLPFAARPAGADSMVPLWPVAQILGDLARYLDSEDARAHYEHAMAIAQRADVEPWRAAATRRIAQLSD
ncbi:MAG: BTAD domain-containing putative transcriptional regulator [Streptosporangiaceae bacterium]